jgi:stage V sporulation protein B
MNKPLRYFQIVLFLLAALRLGLWEELRAVLRQAKTGKNRGK